MQGAIPGIGAALLAITSVLAACNVHAAAGSYSSEAAGPVMPNRKVWYTTVHPPVGSPPRDGKITTVSWRWGVSSQISGLEVKLCYRTAQDCVPVTSYGKAMTQAFAGRPADGAFLLMYRVEGSGRMTPIYGERSQVIVNYMY
ncbi:flagellar protein FlhE [Pigmentiphaga aceris]|uniref:Flagellar protein FlhE n=1 Tax=Pigmentiphaga aceris TaxID=1940612 RepID=A0A5C0AVD1_9BURK|nr:flagellar protein FlhE [Pigmentiphaga aceris]QEI06308.1 flagellar protein FlhE [Pigmentiphaga aceris]